MGLSCRFLIATLAMATLGCATSVTRYRDEASLTSLTVGEAKAKVLEVLDGRALDEDGKPVNVPRLRMRAEQRTAAGDLLEIGEVPLVDRASGRVTTYWFLFEAGRLTIWGRSRDWAFVKSRFPIHFEPTGPATATIR